MRVSLVGADVGGGQGCPAIAAELMGAGHRVQFVRCSSVDEASAAVGRVVSRFPRLVCVCFAWGEDPRPLAALVAKLRELGFPGHITCAGGAESFSHRATIESLDVDSLVLSDHPATLRDLAQALAAREPLVGVKRLILVRSGVDPWSADGDPHLAPSSSGQHALRQPRSPHSSGTHTSVKPGAKSA